MGHVSRMIWYKERKEMPEIKSTVKDIKNTLDMFNTRLNKNKGKLIKLGGGSRGTSRTPRQEKKNEKSRVYKHCVEISHMQ